MNWQSPCSALQTALFSPNWSKGAVVSVVSAKKKKKKGDGGRGVEGPGNSLENVKSLYAFPSFHPFF